MRASSRANSPGVATAGPVLPGAANSGSTTAPAIYVVANASGASIAYRLVQAGNALTTAATSSTLAGLVGPDQISRLRAGFEGWRAGVFGSSEMNLMHHDGTLIPFMVTTSTRSLTGPSEGGVGVLTDLRDIRRAQKALEASELRFRALYLESERQRRLLEARDHLSTALALELEPDAIGRAAIEAISTSLGYSQVTLYTLADEWHVMQHQRVCRQGADVANQGRMQVRVYGDAENKGR